MNKKENANNLKDERVKELIQKGEKTIEVNVTECKSAKESTEKVCEYIEELKILI